MRNVYRDINEMYVNKSSFRDANNVVANALGANSPHRIASFYIILYDQEMFILDHPAVDQVYLCARFWLVTSKQQAITGS